MRSRGIVRVNVTSRHFTCQGAVVVPSPEGYRGRIIDLLNEGPEFIALSNVLMYPTGAEEDDDPIEYDTLLIRKGVIDFVIPYD